MAHTLTSCFQPSPQPILEESTASQWIKLLEYGTYPHVQGLQDLSFQACKALAHSFNSLSAKLKRKFLGVPIYIGHPDDPHFSGQTGHHDTKAYGWVQGLQAKPDGLYIQIRWSLAGEELIHQAFYKFLSPRWEMVATPKSAYRPIRLISIGLTNHPNIPCEALSNSYPVGASMGLKTYCLSNTLQQTASPCSSPDEFITLVHQHRLSHKVDYTEAWNYIKDTQPHLYDAIFC